MDARAGLAAPFGQEAISIRPEAFEIVYVIRDFQLLDPESYQRTYRRRDAKALAKGYYIVSWPPGVTAGRYCEESFFHGPFKCRQDAEARLR